MEYCKENNIALKTDNDNTNRKAGVWGEAPSKVAGATAPDNQPLPRGKGFGVRDNKFHYLKNTIILL